MANFDKRFALLQEFECLREGGLEDLTQMLIGRVATREPHHLWGRTMAFQQNEEVAILCHKDDFLGTCCLEELGIFFIAKAEVANRYDLNTKCGVEPGGDGWRKMRVEPDVHAARMGWFRRRLAY